MDTCVEGGVCRAWTLCGMPWSGGPIQQSVVGSPWCGQSVGSPWCARTGGDTYQVTPQGTGKQIMTVSLMGRMTRLSVKFFLNVLYYELIIII